MAENNDQSLEQNTLLPTDPLREISTEMEESYLDYAMSVIVSRALPDVRDGLKPVHRRIIYAMHKLGLRSGARFRKSAAVVGEVLAKYHPHGDSSVYDAMVRMAQDFSMRYPLVRGQGNFGSIDGDSAAAMRYTEAKMEKITDDLVADIEKDTVDFRDNYDGTHQEPTVMPSRLPNMLLNGGTGIAVGMATNIPPHNLNELIDGCLHLSNNPEATIDDLMEFIKGPDYPGGAMIYDKQAIRQAYATGRGSIIARAKTEIVEEKGKPKIIISEIPFMVNKANMVSKMADLVRDKVINGITDIRDESNRLGIRVVIELRKDSFPNKILNQLFKYTQLQDSFGCNFIALVDGIQPRLMDIKTILEEFLKHRAIVVRRRTEYELRIAKARAHILEGLKKALDHIDEIIAIIRASDTKEIAKTNLMKEFAFSELQTDAILAMRLQTLAGLERKKIEDELAEKLAFIQECEEILADPEKIRAIYENELKEIKEKYGDDRRTEIIPHAIGKMAAIDTIPNEEMIVTLTQGNYIKRFSPTSFRAQARGGKGIRGGAAKEGDEMKIVMHSSNHNNLLYFTSKGRVFQLPVYEIPEAGRTARGQAIVNFLNLEKDETVTAILDTTANLGEELFFCTKNGVIKKTKSEAFSNVRRSGLIAIGLKGDDILQWVHPCNPGNEIMIVTRNGMAIRFKEEDVRSMGRAAAGVRGVRLKKDDFVVEMDVVENAETSALLVVMENGLGKASKVEEFRRINRGGGGVKCANLTKKTGKVVGAKVIEEDFAGDLILIARSGQVIRMAADAIPNRGRATQGVILMRMNGADDAVTGVTKLAVTEEGVKKAIEEDQNPKLV
jgi:DNA gyrase subunit A